MTYTFYWKTGPLSNITEGEYTVNAATLSEAVAEFKDYIADNRDETAFVVSYFYLVQGSRKTILSEFSNSYYRKHFGDF